MCRRARLLVNSVYHVGQDSVILEHIFHAAPGQLQARVNICDDSRQGGGRARGGSGGQVARGSGKGSQADRQDKRRRVFFRSRLTNQSGMTQVRLMQVREPRACVHACMRGCMAV